MSETDPLVIQLLDKVKQEGLNFTSFFYRHDAGILHATFNTGRGSIVTAFVLSDKNGNLAWGALGLPYPATIVEFA